MADQATITQESFYKSLSKLEALAGGGQGEDLDKSQICTGPNSEKKEWAGSRWEDVPGDGPGADKIRPDGTDYNERGVRKSIQEKVEKGIPLSSMELALLKSDMEKADKGDDKADDKGDEGGFPFGKAQGDEDKEKFSREMGKSFDGAVEGSETLQKGIEVSEFLSELSKAFAAGLEGIEQRVNANMQSMGQQLFDTLSGFAGEQGEFNKSLADALVNIGHGVAGSIQQVEQVAQQPAGPPRSQELKVMQGGQQQGFVQKSFAGQQPGEELSKSVVADALHDMLVKGESGISPVEIIKYDTTGELRPDLQQRVQARVQGAGR